MRARISLSFAFLAALGGVAAGCGSLFPSGGGGGPPGGTTSNNSFVLHDVRVNTVGYAVGRAKVATVVLPNGMTSLSNTMAQVVDNSGNVAWT
ncbi:MAG: hypothetical protein ABUR63_10285 [Verrucomicrobiota bacterium]